ncbi:hypothetical protein E2C01_036772 [Portunus trituberculatus]|uniref:Uncharacterized protein n=1 Tax=Portunus trituberculatus TaxID=210409 RepID=A0A5B7FCA1_PORTR|nr:hypothetical protein [Portunus trituberculatus]
MLQQLIPWEVWMSYMYMAGIHHVVRYDVQVLRATYQRMRGTYQCRAGIGMWCWLGRGLFPRKYLVCLVCIGYFARTYVYVRAPYIASDRAST